MTTQERTPDLGIRVEPRAPRRIVQVSATFDDGAGEREPMTRVVAVASDGTAWAAWLAPDTSATDWKRLPDLPQKDQDHG